MTKPEMKCPECNSAIISNGVDAHCLHWKCISCSYTTLTLKQQPKTKTKQETKETLEQLKLDAEEAYLKFQDIIDKITAYVDGSEDKEAEMTEQFKDRKE